MPAASSRLRVGTRGSRLALAQAALVCQGLRALRPGLELEVVVVSTAGDEAPERPLREIGPKGLFAAALQRALLEGRVDLAVHSLKDLPAAEPEGLQLLAVPRREDARDVLVSREGQRLGALKPGARVGTSSVRRAAQVRAARQDLAVVGLRGNVDTRLEKVRRGVVDAAVLAGAGLVRLGLRERVTEWLEFVPAPGQGAIVVEARAGEHLWARELEDAPTRACVEAERSFLREAEGSCEVPLGALARLEGASLVCEGFLCAPDGSDPRRAVVSGDASRPAAVGIALARRLRAGSGE